MSHRMCRFFGMCDYHDHRIRTEGGLLLVWVEKLHKALPSMHEINTCMSNRYMPLKALRDL